MKIGLMGFGTIGTGVYELINIQGKSRFSDSAAMPAVITKILDKDPNKKVYDGDQNAVIVSNVDDILEDPDIELVIALCGGMDFEYNNIKKAMRKGKHVVTANKAVISEYFEELTTIAKENNVILRYEASVGGGIPIISSLKDQLKLNHVDEIKGIINGTTNYILTKMAEENAAFDDALKGAQAIGYAEADPTADIAGHDIARKLAILSSLAYGGIIRDEDVRKRPLGEVSAEDITYCARKGWTIKYLGHSKCVDNKVYTTVEPVIVPKTSVLGNVDSVSNIISIHGDVINELQFYGLGAGKEATANAVVSDVLNVIRDIKYHIPQERESFEYAVERCGTTAFEGRYYWRIVPDSADALSKAQAVLGDLETEWQSETIGQQLFLISTTPHTADKMDEKALQLRADGIKLFYARLYD